MKKISLIVAAFLVFSTIGFAQENGIIADLITKSVDRKVLSFQEMIQFDADQAEKIKAVEMNFLFDILKVETCCLCNKTRRSEKLKKKRDEALQEILPRDAYIKYLSLDSELLNKDNRHWLGNEKKVL